MITFIKNKLSIVSLVIVLIASVFYSYHNRVKDNAWTQIVNADGRGYYAYLPAIFIYGDWNWDFLNEKEKVIFPNNPEYLGDYINIVDGEKVNRYFVGVSILISPFFFIAYFISFILGQPLDGYSFLFFSFVLVSAIFYFILGLNYIRKTLALQNVSESMSALIILGFGLGSNLFYYANYEPSMSHVYSFAMIAGFCYYAKKIAHSYSNKNLILLVIVFGLIFIIRPVNGIVILALPFFFNQWSSFILFLQEIFKNFRFLFLGILIFLFFVSLQSVAYYLQASKLWIYAYGDAKFNFNDPHFFDILFSYRKGLFIYTPITFISLFGFIILIKRNLFQSIVFGLFFLSTTYILSSWSFWWYGGSYGLRAYLEFFPLFMFLLATALDYSVWSKKIIFVLILLCIGLNFVQMYQYQNYILHWEDMNKEKYWNIFLKTDDIYRGALWERKYVDYYKNTSDYSLIYESKNTFESVNLNWTTSQNTLDFNSAHSGANAILLNEQRVFGDNFVYKVEDNFSTVIVKVSAFFYLTSQKSQGRTIVSLENNGINKDYNYKSTNSLFDKLPLNEWHYFSYNLKLGDLKTGDEIKIYPMNSGIGDFYFDDMAVSIYNSTLKRLPKTKDYFIKQIEQDSNWLNSIKIKAKETGNNVERMIELDAMFMEHEELEIIKIEHEMVDDTTQFNIIREIAKSTRKSINDVLTEKATKKYMENKPN